MRDKIQRTWKENAARNERCFVVVVTKHHGIDTGAVNGEWDFQIPQVNEKENYEQIKRDFLFYLFKIHSIGDIKKTNLFLFCPVNYSWI